MQILLENNVTHFTKYIQDVDIEIGNIYMETVIDVSDLENGEYTMYLLSNLNEVITKELVRIGEYTNEYKIKNNFIQYGK